MTLPDMGGLVGVGLILAAYVGVQVDRLDPKRVASLLMNLVGSLLILWSMVTAFNLSAFLMEAAWAATALFGLGRLALGRRG